MYTNIWKVSDGEDYLFPETTQLSGVMVKIVPFARLYQTSVGVRNETLFTLSVKQGDIFSTYPLTTELNTSVVEAEKILVGLKIIHPL